MLKGALVLGALSSMGVAQLAQADTFGTYGNTTVVGGSYQLTALGNTGYAGIYDQVSGPLTPTSLTTLSADYTMVWGTFGGGAPRFSIIDTTNNTYNEAYVYFGTPTGGGSFSDPNLGGTGNYANLLSSDVRVYNNGFGGVNTPNTGETWAQFVASVPNIQIGYITIDLDAGWSQPWGSQRMLVSDFDVNGTDFNPASVAAPLPATAWGGAALLGGLGLLTLRRRRATA